MAAFALCVLAFALRIAITAFVPPAPTADFVDITWYHLTGKLLAEGHGYVNPWTGYPTASWPPGYPLVLAAAYALLGSDPRVGALVNAIAGALTCACCYRLGTLAGGSRRAGLIAAALVAVLPSHVFFAPLLMTESVFAALVCAALLAAGVLLRTPVDRDRLWRWVAWGAGVGVAALVRAEGACVVGVAVAAAFLTSGLRRATRVLVGAAFGVSCVLAPWAYRNAGVFHAFVPLSTGFGRSFWIGHNDAATGAMTLRLQDLAEERIMRPLAGVPGPDGERQRDKRAIALALDYAVHHPVREAELALAKIYYLFRGDHAFLAYYEYRPRPGGLSAATCTLLGRVANVFYVLLLPPALLGWLAFLRSREPLRLVLALFPMLWIALFALLHGDPRFHFPLLPIFCVLAAATVQNRAASQRDVSRTSGGPNSSTSSSTKTARQ